MKEIKRISVFTVFGKISIYALIAYIGLTIIISFITDIQTGWIIGLFPVFLGLLVYLTEYIYAWILGLRVVVLDSLTLELDYGDKVIRINTNDIKRIEQKYDISPLSGVKYKPVFVIYQNNNNKVKINLRLFPQYKNFVDKLNIQIANKERLQLEKLLLRQNLIINDCQYKWKLFKLTFDTTNHQIVFKHAYLTTIIDLKNVKQMILDDIESPYNHQRLRRWNFEINEENNKKTKMKVIFDNFIAQSKQKLEIRETMIAICKMYKIPIKLNLDETKCFE